MEYSDKIKEQYEKMSGIGRLIKLLHISDKELFVLASEIDTYLYLLFLRNVIYLFAIMCLMDGAVLLPLYWTGDVASECNVPSSNPTGGLVVLTDIQ